MSKMKTVKKAAALLLVALLGAGLAGCTPGGAVQDFKNSAIESADGILDFISEKFVTGRLTGTREAEANGVRGTYRAKYQSFSGTEVPFGTTAIRPVIADGLHLTYTITAESGQLEIAFLQKTDTYTVTAEAGSGSYDFALEPGSNYILLKGENFTGSVQLEVR